MVLVRIVSKIFREKTDVMIERRTVNNNLKTGIGNVLTAFQDLCNPCSPIRN